MMCYNYYVCGLYYIQHIYYNIILRTEAARLKRPPRLREEVGEVGHAERLAQAA